MTRLSKGKPYDLVLLEPDLAPLELHALDQARGAEAQGAVVGAELQAQGAEAQGAGEARPDAPSGYALCTWWRERTAALQAEAAEAAEAVEAGGATPRPPTTTEFVALMEMPEPEQCARAPHYTPCCTPYCTPYCTPSAPLTAHPTIHPLPHPYYT